MHLCGERGEGRERGRGRGRERGGGERGYDAMEVSEL